MMSKLSIFLCILDIQLNLQWWPLLYKFWTFPIWNNTENNEKVFILVHMFKVVGLQKFGNWVCCKLWEFNFLLLLTPFQTYIRVVCEKSEDYMGEMSKMLKHAEKWVMVPYTRWKSVLSANCLCRLQVWIIVWGSLKI